MAKKAKETASLGQLTLMGASGLSYEFDMRRIDDAFEPVAAVYVVIDRAPDRHHKIIYVGAADCLPELFGTHPRADCFIGHGANCVCIQEDRNEASRFNKQMDLIDTYRPPCN